MAFTQKLLNFSFDMENGQAGSGGSGNTGKVTGLRASVKIVNAGASQMGQLEASIYGMTLSQMNQFSTVGTQTNLMNRNSITVEAGDINGMDVVFKGTISFAYVDGQSQPQVCFRVTAHAGYYEAGKSMEATSQDGSGDAAEIVQKLASSAGLAFENNGVNIKLSNPYLHGTLREQILRLVTAANVSWTIDRGTLAIWPRDQARSGGSIQISPQSGMVGYPMFNQNGVVIRCLHNPEIALGKQIEVQSQLTPACGSWKINNVAHDLESMTPNGKWFDTIEASRIGTQS